MRAYIAVSMVLLALALNMGCGQSSAPVSAIPPMTTIPGGGYSPLVGKVCFQGRSPCVPPAMFESRCREVGGVVSTKYGPVTCTVTGNYNHGSQPDFTLNYNNLLPIITPTSVRGGVDTGIWLRKGSKLEYYASRSGKWGYFQESDRTFWGGRITFSWFGPKCNSIDWNGRGESGELTNEGQPAGLFGSDGTESFFLGGSREPKAITIKHDGTLRLGINADPNSPFGCTTRGIPRFRLTTCEDANGTSYTCS